MSNLFQKLFSHEHTSQDGLSQPQREAIVDLLFYCMFADNNVALKEDELIADTAEKFSWDPKVSYEAFAAQSLGRARAAKESPESRADFLAAAATRLGSSAAKARAFALCRQLFQADGEVSDQEYSLLRELRKSLS
ncbi:MAG TPA: hypothetical protein VHE13_15715 [Opitutus sp.]|nr:hypothetical protein [Opitutus sp.]